MALALNIGKCTLLGNYRENNEDAIDVKQFPDLTLCLVADGMGGQAAGEIASKRATEVVPRELKKELPRAGTSEAKTISAEEAREHRFRNVLWKYLGTKEVGEGPEVKVINVETGDKFVLCTDGVTGAVPDEKILECVKENGDVQKCADALGQLAL